MAKNLVDVFDDLEGKDNHIYEHCKRVMVDVGKICKKLKVEESYAEDVITAAFYHDIGKLKFTNKLGNPDYKLTSEDFKKMRKHVSTGYNVLKEKKGSNVAKFVLHHHERFDGVGYPKGYKGYDIPYGSRILMVADAFDSMARHYDLWSRDHAKSELEKKCNNQFDALVVDAMMQVAHEEESLKKIISKDDVVAIDDLCGPLKELYHSPNLSLASVIIGGGHTASLHKHAELEEVYYVLEGKGKILVGNNVFDIKKGDTIPILPIDVAHKAFNPYESKLELLVVCYPKFDVELLEEY